MRCSANGLSGSGASSARAADASIASLAADILKKSSCGSRNAWIVVNPLQGDAARTLRRFRRMQMPGEDIPHRRSLDLVDRSPSGHPVAFVGLDAAAVVELEAGNPPPDAFSRCTGVGEAA